MKIVLAPNELAALVSEYIGRRFTLVDGSGIVVSLRSEGDRVWAEADFDALQNNHPKPAPPLTKRAGVIAPSLSGVPLMVDGQPTHEAAITIPAAPSLPPGIAEALADDDELEPMTEQEKKDVAEYKSWQRQRGASAQ